MSNVGSLLPTVEIPIMEIPLFWISDDLLPTMASEVRLICQIIEQWSKQMCPVRTGTLQNSIKIFYRFAGKAYTIFASMVYYGTEVQFGTAKHPGTPFLTMGVDYALSLARFVGGEPLV